MFSCEKYIEAASELRDWAIQAQILLGHSKKSAEMLVDSILAKMKHPTENMWTATWPTKEGLYWFYGW